MFHVLLVEPDDDTCLSLWHGLMQAGGRVTITNSAAGARLVLREASDVRLLITNAFLPDGCGTALAREATARGTPSLIVRLEEDGLRVSDVHGARFYGAIIDTIGFMKDLLRGEPSSLQALVPVEMDEMEVRVPCPVGC
jgi:hypothetical protein